LTSTTYSKMSRFHEVLWIGSILVESNCMRYHRQCVQPMVLISYLHPRSHWYLRFRAPPLMLLQGSQNESAMILREHSDTDLRCLKIWRNCGKKQCLLTRWVSITTVDTPNVIALRIWMIFWCNISLRPASECSRRIFADSFWDDRGSADDLRTSQQWFFCIFT